MENNLTFEIILRDFSTSILHISEPGIFCHLHTVLSTLNAVKVWVVFSQKEFHLV